MHLLQRIHIAHDMIDMGQRQKLVTFLGQIVGHMHLLYMIHKAHEMTDRGQRHATVGHFYVTPPVVISDTFSHVSRIICVMKQWARINTTDDLWPQRLAKNNQIQRTRKYIWSDII